MGQIRRVGLLVLILLPIIINIKDCLMRRLQKKGSWAVVLGVMRSLGPIIDVRKRTSSLILFEVQDDLGEECVDSNTELEKLPAPKEEKISMALSMNSTVGFTGNKTMKLINDKEVLILIDSGASHNFIDPDLVEALKIPTDKSSRFKVQVSDAYNVKGAGVCHDVRMKMQRV